MNSICAIGFAALAIGGSTFVAGSSFAAEETRAQLLSEAKITEAQAKATALGRVKHGTVKSSELEREHGKLVWSFDLSQPSKTGVTEVQVDALTGKVVSMKKETVAQEASEAKADEKTAK